MAVARRRRSQARPLEPHVGVSQQDAVVEAAVETVIVNSPHFATPLQHDDVRETTQQRDGNRGRADGDDEREAAGAAPKPPPHLHRNRRQSPRRCGRVVQDGLPTTVGCHLVNRCSDEDLEDLGEDDCFVGWKLITDRCSGQAK